jgi:hypothetical protein
VTLRVLGRFAAAAALALGLGALSGCSKVVVGKGEAAPASSSSAPSPAPTATEEPSPEVKLLRGKLREAHRLAGYVVRPDTVYGQYDGFCNPSGSFYAVDQLASFLGVFPENAKPAMASGGYVTGYTQCRQFGKDKSLIIGAFILKDNPNCAKAVKALAMALKAKGAKLGGYGGDINSYTVELANQKDYNDPTKKTNTVQRLVCRGAVLNYVWSRSPDMPTARTTDARMMLGQLSAISKFEQTPLDKLPELDDDPEQLRPKHAPLEGTYVAENGGYNLQSYLAMAEDVAYERALLEKDGLAEYFFFGSNNKEDDRYVYRGIGLYKLRDEAAAKDVVTQFTALDKRIHQGIKILTVDGVPDIFCFGYADRGSIVQRCFFSKGPIAVQIDVANATRQFTDVAKLSELVKAQYGKL